MSAAGTPPGSRKKRARATVREVVVHAGAAKRSGSRLYVRKCLRCDKPFRTVNPFHRLCSTACAKAIAGADWF